MSDMTKELKVELEKFWAWSGMTAEQYSIDRGYGEWEVDYPQWNRLCTCFYNSIKSFVNGNESEELVNMMLQAIAIDNEGETLLLECEKELDDAGLEYFIKCSINHVQSEARWQIASLIGKKNKKEWEKYLLQFITDSDKYVQRRALISLSNINPVEAINTALDKIKDEDEYMRLASLFVLEEQSYSNMADVINVLENDRSPIIIEKVKEIKRGLR